MTTLKDLALHLGLSPATVSRALNGYPEVGEKTRKRVLTASRELDYAPSSSARRLATGQSGAVGIVFRSARNLLVDPHFAEFLAGLGSGLADSEIDLMLHMAPPGQQLVHYRRFMSSQSVDGMIVSAPEIGDRRIELLMQQGFPFVVHGRTGDDVGYAFYDIDNAGAFAAATALLYDLGHRRIALINGPADLAFAHQRLAAFNDIMARRGLSVPSAFIAHDEMREDAGYQHAAAMLRSGMPKPPTAFLCSSTLLALGVYRAVAESGLEPGRDVSVVAHDDVLPHFRSENFQPSLTVTRSPIRDASFKLAEMIEAVTAGAEPRKLQHIAPVDLIVRNSTAAVPSTGEDPW